MKILQICSRIPFPIDDGGAVYVYNTTKHLHHLGNEVHIASFHSELHNQETHGLKEVCTLHYKKGGFTPYSFSSIIRSTLTRKVVNVQHRMDPVIMGKILEPLPVDFDVIILAGLHLGNFLTLLRNRFPNTPIVLRHVNVEYELLKRNAENEKNIIKKLILFDQSRLMKKFELNVLSRIDGITFISNVDAEKLNSLTEINVPQLISAPGADIGELIDFEKREENHLVAFSNWKWTPNLDGLIWFLEKVWPLIAQKKPTVKLTLSGNDLPKKVKTKLPKNVTYIGFADNLHEFNSKATIQIIPLKSGSGVKLKMIEGLGFGNPIVSTSYGADGIDIETGKHFELADTNIDFANAVIKLLEDKDARRGYSKNALEIIKKKYSWESQIEELQSFLKSL